MGDQGVGMGPEGREVREKSKDCLWPYGGFLDLHFTS